MFIDRKGLKWSARDAMRAARPNAMLMTLMYLLLTAGMSLVVGRLAADPLLRIFDLYQQGLELERAIPLAVTGVGSVGLFLNILLIVFSVVVRVGYKGWCLNAARGEQGTVSDLIGGFSMVGRILRLYLRIAFFCVLWYVAIIFPAFWCMLLLTLLLGPLGAVISFFGMAVVYLSRVLRYSMAPYCLLDEPEIGGAEALRRSCRMLEGRMKDYFLLMLSFAGWYLLGAVITLLVEQVVVIIMVGPQLLMGTIWEVPEAVSNSVIMTVAMALASLPMELWLAPYVTMTQCKFYDRIKIGPSDQPTF